MTWLPPLLSLLVSTTAPAVPVGATDAGSAAAPPPLFSSPPAASWIEPATRHRPHIPTMAERQVRAANHAATLEPKAQAFENAAQVYPFSDTMIFRVYAAPGQVSDLLLQSGEQLGAVAAGDTSRWIIGDTTSGAGETKRTHVLIKPTSSGLATNLVVTTDRRTYHITLVSTASTPMLAVSWTYPQDEIIALRREQEAVQAAAPVGQVLSLERLNFAYAIKGDNPSWRPLRAFDDGRQTFIEFSPSLAVSEAPPLFVLGAKGEAELVNYRVRGHFYIVDRLFQAAELRLGTRKQEIVRIVRGADSTAASGDRRPS